MMVRDGVLVTPPASEGAFESITVLLIEALARDLGIPTLRRPIERTELLVADEIASVGSLNDLVPITAIDGLPLGPSPILDRLRDRYLAAVSGADAAPGGRRSRSASPTASRRRPRGRRLDRAGRRSGRRPLARRHLRLGLRRPVGRRGAGADPGLRGDRRC